MLSVENFFKKPTKNESPLYHVPTILNNVSGKTVLSEKSFVDLSTKLLWLLMSYNNI